ncbi:hypothetical protein HYPSUDRAFT_34432 [Hypholoma sublateritium FD-334 SS-4]|uniref:RING-type E3 ubiquitin transferase n=1 Tax=Hypholoma sublateritium (strain FD-334 SS-4) TaxID=945553 RepID=A0A0D2PHX3_HYPSF|nr:hypothetical protein HYPSUDRAFT_34432 [Hypholoma sublateritium FD-334 SS-4]
MDANARDEEAGPPTNPPDQRPLNRSSLPSFLFISFMLFMLTSHNGDEFLARHQYQDALQELTYQHANFTAWMNGTESNFTLPESDPSVRPLLDALHIQGNVLDSDFESYYSNVTGFIHGDAMFSNITLSSLESNESSVRWKHEAETLMSGVNTTNMTGKLGSWNWDSSTKVALSVLEKSSPGIDSSLFPSGPIVLIHGRIELTDSSEEDLRLEFEGIHFVANGSIYGFAEVARHIDIRMLPSLVPEHVRNETARAIEPEIQARINKLKSLIDAGIIDSESSGNDEEPKTTCPFTLHAQIHPSHIPEYLMQELESEIQKPTGISTVAPPKLSISGVLLSKECGIMYELKNTEGLRSRMFFRKVTTYAGLSTLAYLTILVLFMRQGERSRTPSGISRVSCFTFLAQATMDSVSFAGHITFAILAEGRPSISLIAPAFLACVVFLHEAQFAALIHQIQAPEDYVPPPPPVASPSPSPRTPTNDSTQEPLLPLHSPLPVQVPILNTTPTTATTTIFQAANNNAPMSFLAFFIHHVRTDPQARLWLGLVIFLTLIVRVILSPLLSVLFVAFTYSSIWLPQIVRSVRRGRSSGLSKEYVLGTTICRLFNALYFLACPKNVLEVEPRSWVWVLAAFVILQAFVVLAQDSLGPTFFLPKQYSHPKLYDYHPPMPLPDPESPEPSLGDCAICMDAILVDSLLRPRSKSFDLRDAHDEIGTGLSNAKKGKSVSDMLSAMQMGVGAAHARKNYSLAPCSHLFHTECLEKWLAIKNICPQCRRPLPPL